ncbi:helix-turn-helix transcriptional regulator [Corynebacterium flavescens]|uniref:helix-turn-helix transcriptional regulator n=1 Tax=Corynebacterium flavescens TaxID=28028 RepID=UPI003F928215
MPTQPNAALSGQTIQVRPLAEILQCSASSLYAAIKDDTFPFPVIRIGGRIVIPTAPIRAALGLDTPAVA